MDPQVRQYLDQIAAVNRPGWEHFAPAEARRLFSGLTDLFGPPVEMHSVADCQIDNGVTLRTYHPSDAAGQPVVMFFHGGGWVLGDIDTHDSLCRRLAAESDCVVVSVDYRCAPEHKFPAAFDDCYNATRYVAEHAGEFGVDAGRLAVAGDSAGGNLAAAVAIKARDVSSPDVRFQLLIYPVVDRDFETNSYLERAEGFGLRRSTMRWFWEQYLHEDAQAQNPYAAPIRADLSGLPAAHVITAEYDVLLDEGESYASKLRDAGVTTTLKRYDGVIHGFMHMAGILDVGREATVEAARELRRAMTTTS